MFNVLFIFFSFLACFMYFSLFPSNFLQFPIHFRSISLYFPFHLLFSFRSFPFILSVKCVSRKAQVPRKRNYRNIDPNPGYRSETIQKVFEKQTQIIFNCALVCFLVHRHTYPECSNCYKFKFQLHVFVIRLLVLSLHSSSYFWNILAARLLR